MRPYAIPKAAKHYTRDGYICQFKECWHELPRPQNPGMDVLGPPAIRMSWKPTAPADHVTGLGMDVEHGQMA